MFSAVNDLWDDPPGPSLTEMDFHGILPSLVSVYIYIYRYIYIDIYILFYEKNTIYQYPYKYIYYLYAICNTVLPSGKLTV